MAAKVKPFPWKCMHCRERTVSPATLPSYQREVEHDGRKYSVALSNFPVLQCSNCGELILDDEANQRISEALRAEAGLLFPAEIRQKREALNLTQKQVAGSLLFSESTLSRWETGAQIQQRCMDKILRAFFDLEALRDYLGTPASTWSSVGDPVPIESVPPLPQDATSMISETLWEAIEADFCDPLLAPETSGKPMTSAKKLRLVA